MDIELNNKIFDIDIPNYYNHSYNNTITNERAVEIPLGFKFLEIFDYNLIEVGAVMPYYMNTIPKNYKCLDPVDKKATIKEYAEKFDFRDKTVLSISTIEHIGMGQYGLQKGGPTSYEVFNKIYNECKYCLISWPIGFNKELDNYFKKELQNFNYFFYNRKYKYPILKKFNIEGYFSWVKRPFKGRLIKPKWKLEFNKNSLNNKYGRPFQNGNSVIFIIKGFKINK